MKRKRNSPQPGNVIEVPLGCCNAYILALRDSPYGIFNYSDIERPPVETIADSGIIELVYVDARKVETGEWPIIGHSPRVFGEDWWSPPVRYPLPVDPRRFMVMERGHVRPATDADKELPLQIKLGEAAFLERLRKRFNCPVSRLADSAKPTSLRSPVRLPPLEAAMSIDHNDVAEQVQIAFYDALEECKQTSQVLLATQRVFEENLSDIDFEIPYWLALANIALNNNCITPEIARKAASIIQGDESLEVVESWHDKREHEQAAKLRLQAISELRNRLDATFTNA